MSAAYWAQWTHNELMSMHGVEIDAYQDDDQDDSHNDNQEHEVDCCSGCMDCLGLSWRDFM